MKRTPKPPAVPAVHDLHLYMFPEDLANFEAVKRLMVALGFPERACRQQDVLRFALKRTAEVSK